MLQDAKFLIRKFNRISHNSQKFQYFELSEINKRMIADQLDQIVREDIIKNRKEAMEAKEAHYEDGDGEFRIPHFESLYNMISHDIDYLKRNKDETWIVRHIREDLTSFLTMSFIRHEFYNNEKFSKLYPMLEHRL